MQTCDYKECKLFGLKSKKTLSKMLNIKDMHLFLDRKKIAQKTYINIISENSKHSRIIETSFNEIIKKAQKRILKYLQEIVVPDYLFSGVKGKTFIDNARVHTGKKYVFKIDISKFFPNTSRNRVYHFFTDKLKTSHDVASILSNLTTVSINDFSHCKNYSKIQSFIKEKKIKQKTHLMTGCPPSVILSFLTNIDMFEKIYNLCSSCIIEMTVYVDDIVLSSNHKIPISIRKKICNIVRDYGYSLSNNKIKYYNYNTPKIITGVVIDKKGKTKTPNSLSQKIKMDLYDYHNTPTDDIRKRLLGRVNIANAIDGSFSSLRQDLQKKHVN